jgi:hypothetical protein
MRFIEMSKTKIYNKLSTLPYNHTSYYELYDPLLNISLFLIRGEQHMQCDTYL